MPRVKRLPALIALLAATVVVLVLRVVLARPAHDPAIKAPWSWLPVPIRRPWIVTQTARAVIDLARFAKSPTPTPPAQLIVSGMTVDPAKPQQFAFRVGARDVAVDVRSYVWDPAAYVTIAQSEGAEAARTTAGPAGDVAAALLAFTVERFQVQNAAISIALQQDYRNPSHHENAALLLSAFALREASRVFYDPRLALCRAAAHLAVARAMRGGAPSSPAGQLADIVLQVVAGRTGPAMKQLEVFERANASPAAQAWTRALRRRATHDWREPTPDSAALVERLEYMRAMARMLEAGASLEYLKTHAVEPAPDWGWRALDLPLTVENGHAFVDSTFERTLLEAVHVLGIHDPGRREGRRRGTLARAGRVVHRLKRRRRYPRPRRRLVERLLSTRARARRVSRVFVLPRAVRIAGGRRGVRAPRRQPSRRDAAVADRTPAPRAHRTTHGGKGAAGRRSRALSRDHGAGRADAGGSTAARALPGVAVHRRDAGRRRPNRHPPGVAVVPHDFSRGHGVRDAAHERPADHPGRFRRARRRHPRTGAMGSGDHDQLVTRALPQGLHARTGARQLREHRGLQRDGDAEVCVHRSGSGREPAASLRGIRP